MGITIRKATMADLPRLMEIFAAAREFMASQGNTNQWINGYPQQELIRKEIEEGHCHACVSPGGRIAATFCLLPSPDPTYAEIYGGAWLNDEPYGVIHRLASDGSVKGIGEMCIEWCGKRYRNLRLDTHEDNHIVQNLARRCGFSRCGMVRIANGTLRIAYQRVL